MEVSSFEQVFKDDLEKKIRLIRALINFESFKNKKDFYITNLAVKNNKS